MLLAGIAHCFCGAGLTLRNGTGQQGKVYRYYGCVKNKNKSKFGCEGTRIREDELDNIVQETILHDVLQIDRLRELMFELKGRHDHEKAVRNDAVSQINGELEKAQRQFTNLLTVAKHSVALGGSAELLAQLDDAQRQVNKYKVQLKGILRNDDHDFEITDEQVQLFSELMIRKIHQAERVQLKGYVQSVVSTVIVSSETIEIVGTRSDLEDNIRREFVEMVPPQGRTSVHTNVREWWA